MADSTSEQTPASPAASSSSSSSSRDERRAARLARQIGAFARKHGGAEATVEYLGRRGARIVLVAADGAWGDLVAPAYGTALAATARAGVEVHEDFAGDLAAKVRTGPYEWSRMAGIQIGGPANPR